MNKIQKLFFGYEDVPACVFFFYFGDVMVLEMD